MIAVPLLRRWLRRCEQAETSRVVVGSTGSGKSEGELVDLVRLADRGDTAVVLLDGHGPLAFAAAGHWAALGHERRIVYEPLDSTDRVLAWDVLTRSDAPDPARRRLEDAETAEEVAQCLLAPRNLTTASDKPYTKEWLDAAIALGLAQPEPLPLAALLDAFRAGTAGYEQLLRDAHDPEVVAKFRGLEALRRRNPVQAEVMTGAARRLLELTCGSEVVRLRARPGPFDWLTALRGQSLVAFDGGGVRTRELKRTLFLLVSLRVIQAARRHFAETRRPLPVVLVLEEAGALGLVTPFVLGALQELRKAGLAVHLLTQSSLDFGDPALFELVLSNTPCQVFYHLLAPSDQELAAKALTNAAFDPKAIQFTRVRSVPEGKSPTPPWRARMRKVIDPYFKPPALQEQEYRTRLAALRVGERLVRERTGVRQERVRMLRPPRVPGGFEAYTHAIIDRVRQSSVYVRPPTEEPAPPAAPLPDAAERLRAEGDAAGE